jgi:hypothetical protein
MSVSFALRRRAPVLLPVLCVALAAFAPSDPLEAQMMGGVKGGIAMGNLFGDAVGNVDPRWGVSAGAFAEFPMGDVFSLQPEVLYTQKGAHQRGVIDVGDGPELGTGSWRYAYIDLALLVRLRVPREGTNSLSFFLGPMYSQLVSARVVSSELGVDRDIEDFTKGSDVGGAIGLMVELGDGPRRILFDLRYTAGTSEFDDVPLDLTYARNHNVIQAMIGVAFGGARGPG